MLQHRKQAKPPPESCEQEQDNDNKIEDDDLCSKKQQKTKRMVDTTKLLRLLFCASGICGCYITYGVLQERLYQSHSLGPSFILFTQSITNILVSIVWMLLLSSRSSSASFLQLRQRHAEFPHTWLIITAACYSIAMVCSNEAVKYVSYPIQVLAKSCKLIPTMLVGQFMDTRRRTVYGSTEWYAALLICSGIVWFHLYQEQSPSSSQTSSTQGNLLLLTSLVMDGFLSSFQNRVKQAAVSLNAAETMFYINLYALCFLYVICQATGQWKSSVQSLQQLSFQQQQDGNNDDGTALLTLTVSLFILNATVGLGQVFIFLTIDWFSPVTTTLITTTRKFLTIVISSVLYSHKFRPIQWMAIATVFSGLYMAILATVLRKPSSASQQHSKNE